MTDPVSAHKRWWRTALFTELGFRLPWRSVLDSRDEALAAALPEFANAIYASRALKAPAEERARLIREFKRAPTVPRPQYEYLREQAEALRDEPMSMLELTKHAGVGSASAGLTEKIAATAASPEKIGEFLGVQILPRWSILSKVATWFIRPTSYYEVHVDGQMRGAFYYQPGDERVTYNILVGGAEKALSIVRAPPGTTHLVHEVTHAVHNSIVPFYEIEMPESVAIAAELEFEGAVDAPPRSASFLRRSLAVAMADMEGGDVDSFNAAFCKWANLTDDPAVLNIAMRLPHYMMNVGTCWHYVWPYFQKPTGGIRAAIRRAKWE